MSSTTESASLSDRLARLVESFRAGEERALARAISEVESERPGFEKLLHVLHEGVGRARRIGITGPPGAGKSTLTAALARLYRDRDLTVGVLATDPTSPFTGGALLGDRVRMAELGTEPGVFIRSMASRGAQGGLATASREAADLMDAFGFDRVVLETVGVGQSELEVADSADTTVVVLVPESGDGIQAMKAGLMEVADLFVVNKADRPGADRLRKEIEVVKRLRSGEGAPGGAGHHGFAGGPRGPLEGGRGGGADDAGREESAAAPAAERANADGDAAATAESEGWEIPVLTTVASAAEGIEELLEEIERHYEHLERTGRLEERRREHLLRQAEAVLLRRSRRTTRSLWQEAAGRYVDDLTSGRMTPYEVADAVERSERTGGGAV